MRRMLLFALVLVLLSAAPAAAVKGQPFVRFTINVGAAAVGITQCGVGSLNRTTAVIMVQTNTIYYYFSQSGGNANPGAGDFVGNPGDVIELAYPDLFKMIQNSGAATVSGACFQE